MSAANSLKANRVNGVNGVNWEWSPKDGIKEREGRRMVKVEKWSDFDYALSGKALAKSHRRWWQGFSLPPILCGYISLE